MSAFQLLVLAIVSMTGLATLRLVRGHLGREPLFEGNARILFVLVFLFVPPIVLGAVLIKPAGDPGQLPALTWVPLYALMLGGLLIATRLIARLVRHMPRGRSRRLLLIGLVGSDRDRHAVRVDPAVTTSLAESMALVDSTNAVFPRGPEFPAQIDRPGFRTSWDALDTATRTLEGRIAEDDRLGVAVASAATATAVDARSRLDTLRRLTVEQSQATWAATLSRAPSDRPGHGELRWRSGA